MPYAGRIRAAARAAWDVLWGRSEVQLRMARIEREWVSIELEVSAMFDNVNALLARMSKRKRRQDTDEGTLEVAPTPELVSDKAALRRRVAEAKRPSRGARGVRQLPPTQEKVS